MLGDNISSLKKLPDNSIDSIVSDPPYGLSFMGKKWDYDVPSVEFWKEVYRVLKPGGHVLAFGGTRTYHRLVVNIEDSGFEIRDQIQWIYGQGFPKSLNINKAISEIDPSNKDFDGFGTNLKPANEPICVARKPLSEKSVAENVLKWGTGGINIDGCRVGSDSFTQRGAGSPGDVMNTGLKKDYIGDDYEGRFPANIILECLCDEVIKGEKGEVKKSGGTRENCDLSHEWGYDNIVRTNFTDKGDIHTNPMCPCYIMDEQSDKASRFFYQAKVSKSERNMGLDGFEDKKSKSTNMYDMVRPNGTNRDVPLKKNTHPTVKPVALMAYLCRLVTPPNGIVLDPFMGSGSTGIAAQLEGFRFCGMELDEDYFKIAEARINDFEKYRKFIK
jgi:site-specific DNA-methyltransferase (adenine-specific)